MRRRWFRFGRLSRIAALVAAALAVPGGSASGVTHGGGIVRGARSRRGAPGRHATPGTGPWRGRRHVRTRALRAERLRSGMASASNPSVKTILTDAGPGFVSGGRYAYGGYGLDGFGLAGFGLDSGFPPAPAPAVDGGPGADDPVIPAPRTCIPPLIIKIGPGPRHPPTTRVVYGPPVCGG